MSAARIIAAGFVLALAGLAIWFAFEGAWPVVAFLVVAALAVAGGQVRLARARRPVVIEPYRERETSGF